LSCYLLPPKLPPPDLEGDELPDDLEGDDEGLELDLDGEE